MNEKLCSMNIFLFLHRSHDCSRQGKSQLLFFLGNDLELSGHAVKSRTPQQSPPRSFASWIRKTCLKKAKAVATTITNGQAHTRAEE